MRSPFTRAPRRQTASLFTAGPEGLCAPFRKKGYKVTLSLKPKKLAKKRVTKGLHVTEKGLHFSQPQKTTEQEGAEDAEKA